MPVRNAAGTSRSRATAVEIGSDLDRRRLLPAGSAEPLRADDDRARGLLARPWPRSRPRLPAPPGSGSAPSSSKRSAAFSSSICTTLGAGAWPVSILRRRSAKCAAASSSSASVGRSASRPGGPVVLRGRPREDGHPGRRRVGAISAGAPASSRSPLIPGAPAERLIDRIERSGVVPVAGVLVFVVVFEGSARCRCLVPCGWHGHDGLGLAADDDVLLIGCLPGRRLSSGSSHSTSLMGAKNLSRSSNRSSLSRSSSAHSDLHELLFLVALDLSISATYRSVSF